MKIAILIYAFLNWASYHFCFNLGDRRPKEDLSKFDPFKEAKKEINDLNKKIVQDLLKTTINRANDPDNIDWSFIWEKNDKLETYSRPPRDQKSCGSCAAHVIAALGEAEIYFYIQNQIKAGKKLQEISLRNYYLSVKNIVYCDSLKANACDFGVHLVSKGNFRSQDSGMFTEHQLPYKDIKKGECAFNKNSSLYKDFKDKAYVMFDKSKEFNILIEDSNQRVDAIKKRLIQGPVGVGIKLKGRDIFSYDGKDKKFFDNKSCGTIDDIHAVLIVSIVNIDGKEYFKFRNSYGKLWGNKGYGYLWVEKYQECSQPGVAQLGEAIPSFNSNYIKHDVSESDLAYLYEDNTYKRVEAPVKVDQSNSTKNNNKESELDSNELQFETDRQVKRKLYLLQNRNLPESQVIKGDDKRVSDSYLIEQLKLEGKW